MREYHIVTEILCWYHIEAAARFANSEAIIYSGNATTKIPQQTIQHAFERDKEKPERLQSPFCEKLRGYRY